MQRKKQPLRLVRESIRVLSFAELGQAAGGIIKTDMEGPCSFTYAADGCGGMSAADCTVTATCFCETVVC